MIHWHIVLKCLGWTREEAIDRVRGYTISYNWWIHSFVFNERSDVSEQAGWFLFVLWMRLQNLGPILKWWSNLSCRASVKSKSASERTNGYSVRDAMWVDKALSCSHDYKRHTDSIQLKGCWRRNRTSLEGTGQAIGCHWWALEWNCSMRKVVSKLTNVLAGIFRDEC